MSGVLFVAPPATATTTPLPLPHHHCYIVDDKRGGRATYRLHHTLPDDY